MKLSLDTRSARTVLPANVLAYRDLLIAWTVRTVRARYQQSILGGLWAVLQPAAIVAVFTVVFTQFIPVNTGDIPYVVYSYSAMVPWTLFSASIADMTDSLVANLNLVSKIYFPREILVIAASLARLIDFGIAFVVLFLLMALYRIPLFQPAWLYLPLIMATQLALALGLGLASAAINVFFRDVKHLVALGLQLWLYATPIIYPVSLVPERWRQFYFLNPMAGTIEAYRAILLHGTAPDSSLWISSASAFVILVSGYVFFKRVEFRFADVI
jgi:lipopolysaccharide transport system permease protein